MIKVFANLNIDESDIEFTYIRSSGPGGQNVNKVASGVQLRFNIQTSRGLTEDIRARLLLQNKNKLTNRAELIIKAIRFRTQERNKNDALKRLINIIQHAAIKPKKRKKTKPTMASIEKRITSKKRKGKSKSLRNKIWNDS